MAMKELIVVINQLQEVFSLSGYEGIDLPQVVVVGTQSSGKSSVLEHLVGRSFLPRGTGVVTRCPLILQMSPAAAEEYAVFQHNTSKIFTDYNLINKEIDIRTEFLAGANKGICKTPIILKLHSPSFIDLTLVDLPGLTKVPVGDQPCDIEDQTRGLIMEYVKNPNSIILAITPANTDMATSDSLKISRDVDPEGKRTVAVVTKLDIMDEGTNAEDMLCGKIIPVKLGIIGVVNRSQKDVLQEKSIEESLADEVKFFERKYKNIASQHGTTYLKNSVQKILLTHIAKCLPEIKKKISQQLASCQEEFMLIGDGKFDRTTILLNVVNMFSHMYRSAVEGNLSDIGAATELFGGARINHVFEDTLFNDLKSIDALDGLSETAISIAIKNASGASSPLFVPKKGFELLVKQQMQRLREPCLKSVKLVHGELSEIGEFCLQNGKLDLPRFPKLLQEISDIFCELLKKRVKETKVRVDDFVNVQLAHINTAHPRFFSNQLLLEYNSNVIGLNSNNSTMTLNKYFESWLKDVEIPHPFTSSGSSLEQANRHCQLIQELIENYFSLVKELLQDTIPKIIKHFLVSDVMDNLHSHLVKKLYGRDELLDESLETIDKRAGLVKSIAALERATGVLKTINRPFMKCSSTYHCSGAEDKLVKTDDH